ncbi:MAG: U32 family peptidase, partial [Dehalococcoidia bacterium]|nr:U32 family peptidase [Dehalococcoidia bacterium]
AGLLRAADRIILPRELSLEEVKHIVRSGVEVEVFVHGALCFSYSGLCLMSSFVHNRSGNRGCCAQLCRKRYNGSYCLSTRELCLVRRIPELVEAGISGFKIEGRMRTPLYVAVATRLYRKAIDSYLEGRFQVPEKEMSEIEVVFNREFTEGFMFGDVKLLSPEKPMNRGAFLGVVEGGRLVLQRPVAVGDGVGVWGRKAVTGAVIRRILIDGKQVTSAEAGHSVDLGLQWKDGDRVYLTSSTRISIEPDFIVRRRPIGTIKRRSVRIRLPRTAVRREMPLRLLVKVYSLTEAMDAVRAGADFVFYDILASDFPAREEWTLGPVLGAFLPRIAGDALIVDVVERLKEKRPWAVLAGNLGFLAFRDQISCPVYLDYSLNAFNGLDLEFFRRFGVTPVLSPELSMKELEIFQSNDVVILCHGDVVVMNTKIEIGVGELVDERGYKFAVRRENGYWQVLNSRPMGLFNDIRKLTAMGFSQFLIDKAGEGPRWVHLYRSMLEHEVSDRRLRKGYTSGHFYRPVL